MISRLYRTRKPSPPRVLVVALGVVAPLIGIALSLAGIKLFGLFDPAYIVLAFGGIIIAFWLFRNRSLDIVPIARDMLIERMQDGVFVFDNQCRLIDANPAALAYLDDAEGGVIGRLAEEVIPDWDDLIHEDRYARNGAMETSIGEGIERIFLSLRLTELFDEKGAPAGLLVVVRDITEQKRAEEEVRSSNRKLVP